MNGKIKRNESKLEEAFEFRSIRLDEAEQAALIEQLVFPPNEAIFPDDVKEQVRTAPELFLVAVDKTTDLIAGFLNGISTDEEAFRDDFFTDKSLYNPAGKNVMLLGLDVLPEYRGRGLAKALVQKYRERERANGRAALILTCLPELVDMYTGMGFEDLGISASTWGGETWHEMRMSL